MVAARPPGVTVAPKPPVVILVAATRGSTPREVGARMTVWPERVEGTVGGGHLEYDAIRLARLLPAGETGLARYALGASLGQCCGGEVLLAFVPGPQLATATTGDKACLALTCLPDADHRGWGMTLPAREAAKLIPPEEARLAAARGEGVVLVRGEPSWLVVGARQPGPHVLLLGAGHVGQALATLLAPLDCRLDWIDDRDDVSALPLVEPIPWQDVDPVSAVARAPAGSHVIIMTHDHGLDYAIVDAALARDDLAFVGLIGSMTKRRRFVQRLKAAGVSERRIARLHCPLGVTRIRDKSPQAIAIIVAAQLLCIWDSARDVEAEARSGAVAAT